MSVLVHKPNFEGQYEKEIRMRPVEFVFFGSPHWLFSDMIYVLPVFHCNVPIFHLSSNCLFYLPQHWEKIRSSVLLIAIVM